MSLIYHGWRENRKRKLSKALGSGADPNPEAGEQALRAYDFASNVGVCAHLERGGSNAYGDLAATKTAVATLRVKQVRSRAYPTAKYINAVNGLFTDHGVKTMMNLGKPAGAKPSKWPTQTLSDVLAAGINPDAIEAFEWANEQNLASQNNLPANGYAESDWLLALTDHGTETWNTIRDATRPVSIQGKTVLGPSYGNPNNTTRMKTMEIYDFDAQCHVGNLHRYYYDDPGGSMDAPIANTRQYIFEAPGAELWCTECGYHNLLSYSGGHKPTPKDVAANQIVKYPFEWFARGVKRMYFYQLLDEGPGTTSNQDHFGQFLYKDPATAGNFAIKPQGQALANLISLYADPTGAAYSPGKLDYTISGGGTDLRHALYQRSDGAFLLSLWRDVAMWKWHGISPNYGDYLALTTDTITVTFAASRNVEVRKPSNVTGGNGGLFLVQTLTGVTSVSTDLIGDMTVLVVT
jgi:hypothetical protein